MDTKQILSTVPYQDVQSPPMTPHFRKLAPKTLLVFSPGGQVYSHARAVLFVYKKLGYHFVTPFWYAPLRWPIELGYRILAGNRIFFSKFLFREE